MKILIAGATGLIGTELVKQCLKEGITVHYLTTRKSKIKQADNHKGFYWDPSKNTIDETAFEGVEVIVNLAGASVSKSWTQRYKKTIIESRVQTADIIYDTLATIKHTVKHYISASGISVYPHSLNQLYTEDYPEIANTFLGEVVKVWEQAANRFEGLGMDVAKIRTGIVLAPEEGAFPKLLQPIKYGFGAPLGSGKQWQSWIHIKDIASIYLFVITNKLAGNFNGVSPNPKRNGQMTKIIAAKLNKRLWLPNVPKFMLKLLLGERAGLVLESQLVSAEKIQKMGFQFGYVNLENALEDLLSPEMSATNQAVA